MAVELMVAEPETIAPDETVTLDAVMLPARKFVPPARLSVPLITFTLPVLVNVTAEPKVVLPVPTDL